jgi:hypothetical protein
MAKAPVVKNWWAVESPSSSRELATLLRRLPRPAGLVLRCGTGISPLALIPGLEFSGVSVAMMMQLRDNNAIALESLVKGALFAGIRRIFVGDPKPLMGVKPVGPMDGPEFVRAALAITGRKVEFGVCNRCDHPADLALLERYREAGVKLAVVPPECRNTAEALGFSPWNWLFPGRTSSPAPKEAGVFFFDFLETPIRSLPGLVAKVRK